MPFSLSLPPSLPPTLFSILSFSLLLLTGALCTLMAAALAIYLSGVHESIVGMGAARGAFMIGGVALATVAASLLEAFTEQIS